MNCLNVFFKVHYQNYMLCIACCRGLVRIQDLKVSRWDDQVSNLYSLFMAAWCGGNGMKVKVNTKSFISADSNNKYNTKPA